MSASFSDADAKADGGDPSADGAALVDRAVAIGFGSAALLLHADSPVADEATSSTTTVSRTTLPTDIGSTPVLTPESTPSSRPGLAT